MDITKELLRCALRTVGPCAKCHIDASVVTTNFLSSVADPNGPLLYRGFYHLFYQVTSHSSCSGFKSRTSLCSH